MVLPKLECLPKQKNVIIFVASYRLRVSFTGCLESAPFVNHVSLRRRLRKLHWLIDIIWLSFHRDYINL